MLRRVCFRHGVIGALVGFAVTIIVVLSHATGEYISLRSASHAPMLAMTIVGPFLAMVAAYGSSIASGYTSIVANPLYARVRGNQAMSEYLAFQVPVLVGILLGSVSGLGILTVQASGGSVAWVRIIPAVLAALVVSAVGFLAGMSLAGHWGLLVAPLVVILLGFLPQTLMSALSEEGSRQPGTAIFEFSILGGPSAPAGFVTAAWASMYGIVAILWLSLCLTIWLVQRTRASITPPGIAASSAALPIALLAAGIMWGSTGPVLSRPYRSADIVCQEFGGASQLCLTPEEAPILRDRVSRLSQASDKLNIRGAHETVMSAHVDPGAVTESRGEAIVVSVTNRENMAFQYVSFYTGLSACGSHLSRASETSYALTMWAIDDESLSDVVHAGNLAGDDPLRIITSMSDTDIRDLYANHRDEIQSCGFEVEPG